MQVSFNSAPAPPSRACISSRCLIGDKHAGQCRPHHNGPSFTHHANNCQAMGPPRCCALIDSSPLTRFMGVRTFHSVTSNWSTGPLAGGPGPWLAGPDSYPPPCERQRNPSDELSTSLPWSSCEDEPTVFLSDQHLLSKHRCVFNQLLREKYLAWAVKRANIQVCQG